MFLIFKIRIYIFLGLNDLIFMCILLKMKYTMLIILSDFILEHNVVLIFSGLNLFGINKYICVLILF